MKKIANGQETRRKKIRKLPEKINKEGEWQKQKSVKLYK